MFFYFSPQNTRYVSKSPTTNTNELSLVSSSRNQKKKPKKLVLQEDTGKWQQRNVYRKATEKKELLGFHKGRRHVRLCCMSSSASRRSWNIHNTPLLVWKRSRLRNMTFTRQATVFVSARHGNHSAEENTAKRRGDVFTVRHPATSRCSCFFLLFFFPPHCFNTPLVQLKQSEVVQKPTCSLNNHR